MRKDGMRLLSFALSQLLLILLVAAFVIFGNYIRFQHSDNAVIAILSTSAWSPYLWEQNRYGMLLPLLTSWIHGPFTNFLVESFLNIAAGLSSIYLISVYLFLRIDLRAYRDSRLGIPGLIAVLLLLISLPLGTLYDYFSLGQPYGLSICLTVTGLLCLFCALSSQGDSQWNRVKISALNWTSCILVLVGFWVAPTPFLIFAGMEFGFLSMCALRSGSLKRPTEFLKEHSYEVFALAILLFSFLVNRLMLRASWDHHNYAVFLSPRERLPSLITYSRVFMSKYITWPVIVSVLVAFAGIWIGVRRKRMDWVRIGIATLIAVIFFVFVSELLWTKANLYYHTYPLPAVVLAYGIMGACISGAVAGWSKRNRTLVAGLATFAIICVSIMRFQPRSPRRVRTIANDMFGRYSDAIIDHRCTYTIGNYWKVWIRLMMARQRLLERGGTDHIWGITYRAGNNEYLWRREIAGRFCGYDDDDSGAVQFYVKYFKLPKLRQIEKVDGITVYLPEL